MPWRRRWRGGGGGERKRDAVFYKKISVDKKSVGAKGYLRDFVGTTDTTTDSGTVTHLAVSELNPWGGQGPHVVPGYDQIKKMTNAICSNNAAV